MAAITYNKTVGGPSEPSWNSFERGAWSAYAKMDFGDGGTYLTTDIIQLIQVPKNTHVEHVFWRVLTAEGAASTPDIGDYAAGGNEDDWQANLDINATSDWVAGDGAYATLGKTYVADDTIDITVGAATLDLAVIEVCAVGFYLGPPTPFA